MPAARLLELQQGLSVRVSPTAGDGAAVIQPIQPIRTVQAGAQFVGALIASPRQRLPARPGQGQRIDRVGQQLRGAHAAQLVSDVQLADSITQGVRAELWEHQRWTQRLDRPALEQRRQHEDEPGRRAQCAPSPTPASAISRIKLQFDVMPALPSIERSPGSAPGKFGIVRLSQGTRRGQPGPPIGLGAGTGWHRHRLELARLALKAPQRDALQPRLDRRYSGPLHDVGAWQRIGGFRNQGDRWRSRCRWQAGGVGNPGIARVGSARRALARALACALDHVQQHTGVGRVVVMAVLQPGAWFQVQLDIAAPGTAVTVEQLRAAKVRSRTMIPAARRNHADRLVWPGVQERRRPVRLGPAALQILFGPGPLDRLSHVGPTQSCSPSARAWLGSDDASDSR